METNNTLQEQAKKLRKMRRRQRIASLLGIAVLVWGVVQAAFLFLDYKNTETSNDAQVEQYISPVNLRASGYIQKSASPNIRTYTRATPCWCSTTANTASA